MAHAIVVGKKQGRHDGPEPCGRAVFDNLALTWSLAETQVNGIRQNHRFVDDTKAAKATNQSYPKA